MNTAPKLLTDEQAEVLREMRDELASQCDGRPDADNCITCRVRREVIDAVIALAPPSGEGVDSDRREFLGKLVRMEWVAWAREQPNAKPSWLLPWEKLTEPDREVDRRIGERIYQVAVIDATTPQSAPVDGDADQPAGGWDAVDADNGFRHYPWTYQNQPGNVGASVLGGACNQASAASAGDTIDRGLGLLKALHERGFGIVRVPKIAVQDDPTPPPASQERGRLQVFHCREADDGEAGCAKWCGNRTYCPVSGEAEPSPPSSAAEQPWAARSSASSSPAGYDDAVEGSIPSASPPSWICECGQRNTSWATECGRCERLPNTPPPDAAEQAKPASMYGLVNAEQAQAGEFDLSKTSERGTLAHLVYSAFCWGASCETDNITWDQARQGAGDSYNLGFHEDVADDLSRLAGGVTVDVFMEETKECDTCGGMVACPKCDVDPIEVTPAMIERAVNARGAYIVAMANKGKKRTTKGAMRAALVAALGAKDG